MSRKTPTLVRNPWRENIYEDLKNYLVSQTNTPSQGGDVGSKKMNNFLYVTFRDCE